MFLQAADVFCWHYQRRNADNLQRGDAHRLMRLIRRLGTDHIWTDEELTAFAKAVVAQLDDADERSIDTRSRIRGLGS